MERSPAAPGRSHGGQAATPAVVLAAADKTATVGLVEENNAIVARETAPPAAAKDYDPLKWDRARWLVAPPDSPSSAPPDRLAVVNDDRCARRADGR